MRFGVLGPLEVWDGERSLQLGGSKRRALLALLILNANEVMRTERLADELWGEHPPRNAVASIHNHVSRLRKELGAEALGTHRWGYVLRADPDSIDATRFEQLMTQAEALPAAERASCLAEALSLWRGAPLADLAQEPAVANDIAVLEERRLVALERRIDADLETGKDAELVPELEALIEKDPLREHFRWQLILALYRSGRQAAALEVYRETRRLLFDELGLEPGPELRALEGAILRHDPSLAPPPRERPEAAVPERTRQARRRAYAAVGALMALVALAGAGYLLLADDGQKKVAAGGPTTGNARVTPESKSSGLAAHQPRSRSHRSNVAGQDRTSTRSARKGARQDRAQSTRARSRAAGRPTNTARQTPPSKTTPPSSSDPPAPPPPPLTPPTLADRTAWWTAASQPQVTVTYANAAFTVNVASSAADGFNAGVGTRCQVVGDFDARATFQLLQWPGADGVWVSLMAADLGGVNTYRSDSFGEVYGAYVPPSGGTSVHSRDTSGVMRLAREGGTITGSYRVGDNWTTIFSGKGPTADTAINLSVFNLPNVASFAGRPVAVRFNAFTLTANKIVC